MVLCPAYYQALHGLCTYCIIFIGAREVWFWGSPRCLDSFADQTPSGPSVCLGNGYKPATPCPSKNASEPVGTKTRKRRSAQVCVRNTQRRSALTVEPRHGPVALHRTLARQTGHMNYYYEGRSRRKWLEKIYRDVAGFRHDPQMDPLHTLCGPLSFGESVRISGLPHHGSLVTRLETDFLVQI